MDRDEFTPNNPIHASLVEEEARESNDRALNSAPRFSPDTKVHEKNPSAKHHSFSIPATVSHLNSDEPDRLIPGAYPMDDNGHSKKVGDINSQLPSKEIPSGSKVGVGSLPGNFNEPGVATLPEERIDGRPYGSGHTGFEETLGNRTTFVQNTSPSKSKEAPHYSSGSSKGPYAESNLKNDQQKPVSYASQHSLSESSHVSSQPSADAVKSMASTVGGTLPGLAQGTGSALNAAMHAGSQVLGAVEGATVDAIPKVRQETGGAFNAAVHAGGAMLGSMEKATVDAMHGAEHMLSDIGEGAKSYMPNVGAYFGVEQKRTQGQDANVKHPFKPRPPLVSSNSSGSFVTSGVDAPNSRSRSRLDLAHSDSSSVHLNSGLVTPSSMDSESADPSHPSKLPNVIKKEYCRSVEYDLDGEEINTEAFLYENDFSSSDTEGGIHHPHGTHHHHRHHLHHKHDSGAPAIPRHGTAEHGDDIVEGVGGVTYYRSAKDGKLPGFPTEAGMKQLISDRMKEDKERAATRAVPSVRVTDFGLRSSAGRTNEGKDLSSELDWTDSELEDRNVEEKKEVPIFMNGATTAAGKFEAVFRPVSQPDATRTVQSVPEKKLAPTATGNIKSSLNPQAPPFVAHSTRSAPGQRMTPGYLGKPVSEAEINSEVEQARREIDRKLGVN